MTQHSEHGGFITGQRQLIADDPVCTAYVRNVIANNAIHAYDMASAVRVHDIAKKNATGWLGDGGSSWSYVRTWSFPVAVRADGSHRPLVCWLASRAKAATTTSWALQLRPFDQRDLRGLYPGGPDENAESCTIFSTNSTTIGWLTPSRLTIQIPTVEFQRGYRTISTPEIDGGNASSVRMPFLSLDAFMKNDDSNSGIRGLYVREYIG